MHHEQVEVKPDPVAEDRPAGSPAKRSVAASQAERALLGSLTCRQVESEVRRRLDAPPGQLRLWSGDQAQTPPQRNLPSS